MKLLEIAQLPESNRFTISGQDGIWEIFSRREGGYYCCQVDEQRKIVNGTGRPFSFDTEVELYKSE